MYAPVRQVHHSTLVNFVIEFDEFAAHYASYAVGHASFIFRCVHV